MLHDGRAGNRRQATALCAALGIKNREFTLELAQPWRWLAPHLRWPWPLALPRPLRDALAMPPALVIGCGRSAALANAMLRRHVPGCRAIQILDPRIPARHFDWVVAPAHDGLGLAADAGSRVIETLGALNPVDSAWLRTAALGHQELADWPRPRLAVLVGGPHRHWRFDAGKLGRLLEAAAGWQQRFAGSVWITTSRRTPQAFDAVLAEFASRPHRLLYVDRVGAPMAMGRRGSAPDGVTANRNPYPGMLAHADAFLVTADSVNLASEACATDKPVFVFDAAAATGKLARFHAALATAGHARESAEIVRDPAGAPPRRQPLREAADVAATILAALPAEFRSRFDPS